MSHATPAVNDTALEELLRYVNPDMATVIELMGFESVSCLLAYLAPRPGGGLQRRGLAPVPIVACETTIDAPVGKVYHIARDIESYPQFAENIASVEVLKQTRDRQISVWASHVKQLDLDITWTSDGVWDEVGRKCTFRQTRGDFLLYRGCCEFRAREDGTTGARLALEYEYGAPLVGGLVRGMLRSKAQSSINSVVAAIKARAEAR